MSHTSSAGRRLRDALAIENPLQVVGTINSLLSVDGGARGIPIHLSFGAGAWQTLPMGCQI